MDLVALNERLGLGGQVEFVAGQGGLPQARLQRGASYASVALQGGHLIAYGEAEAPPIIWVSREALYAPGKAIRGGIPICWPWFGPHPSDPSKPAHGFVRTLSWEPLASGLADDGAWLRLGLRDSAATLALWPHAFALELTITLGTRLDVALLIRNSGDTPFTCGGALHSYFRVADIARATILGLEDKRYLDQLTGEDQLQQGPISIASEVDRVYQDAGDATMIVDELLGRRIVVQKAGSRSTVVWNPWVEKARRLADFGDDEYQGMLCVETALALHDSVTLAPGATHTLRARIWAEPV